MAKAGQPAWKWLIVPFVLLALAGILMAESAAVSRAPLRIGLLGDSSIDEYQGSDFRGGLYHAVTFNWIEQLVRRRGFYAGAWGSYPEPRRVGYGYLWARSGLNTCQMIESGQHTGLAQQVAAGEIDLVFMSIGANDFAPYRSDGYAPIYDGTLSGAALQAKLDGIVADMILAVDTVRAAGPVPVVITTIGDWGINPIMQFHPLFSDPLKRQRVTDAIAYVNAQVRQLSSARPNIGIVDQDVFVLGLLAQAPTGILWVDGEPIRIFSVGDEPHNGILGDYIHVGTVIEGRIANFYLGVINQFVEPDIAPMSDVEILANAGLRNLPPTATLPPPPTATLPPTAEPTATPYPTPTPAPTDLPDRPPRNPTPRSND